MDFDAYTDLEVDEHGNFAVLWYDSASGGLKLGRYGQRGALWGPITAATAQTTIIESPSLAVDADGDIVVAWNEYAYGTRARRFTPDGAPLEDFIAAFTPQPWEAVGGVAVAMDADGDVAVAFEASYEAGRIGVQRFRSTAPIDLSLSQSDSADPVARGATYTYAVNVSNLTSPSTGFNNSAVNKAIGAATNLRFDFKLTNATFQFGTGTDWICEAPLLGLPNCRYAKPLNAGASAPLVTLTVKATTSTRVSIASDDATLVPVQIDPNTTNNREIENTLLH